MPNIQRTAGPAELFAGLLWLWLSSCALVSLCSHVVARMSNVSRDLSLAKSQDSLQVDTARHPLC
jgi:hypothetical protein